MTKRLLTIPWLILLLILLLVALLLSACGDAFSGEPEIEREIEVLARPTAVPTNTGLPVPTAAPTDEVVATDAPTDITATDVAPADDVPTGDAPTEDAGEVAIPPTEAAAEAAPEPTTAPDDTLIDTGGGDYDLGFTLYVQECAQCHGAEDGVGPSLATMHNNVPTRDTDQTPVDYVRQSILEPGAYLVEGYFNSMPQDFAAWLSEDDVAALTTFILEFDPSRMGMGDDDTAADSGMDEPETMFTVQGHLVVGTAGGEAIPAGLPMDLFIFDPAAGVEMALFEVDSVEGGTFEFTEIPYVPNMAYYVETDYQGIRQGARVDIPATPGDAPVTTEVRLYEHTTDPAGVMVTWTDMRINYAPINDFGVEVLLSVELANTGDRMVTTDHALEDGTLASVVLELPVNAFGIQIIPASDMMRYEVTVVDGVPLVLDRSPLRPGQVHTIALLYYLPYETDATFVTAFGYPVIDGAILLPNDTVDFESAQYDMEGRWQGRVIQDPNHGTRIVVLEEGETIDPDRDYTLIQVHYLTAATTADDPLIFALDGRPTRTIDLLTQTGPGSAEDDSNWLPLVLGAAGAGVILMAVVLWWRQRRAELAVPDSQPQPKRPMRPTPAPRSTVSRGTATRFVPRAGASKEVLLAALADLDDAFKADEIDEDVYHAQRAIITERLLPLLNEEEE
ncbi:MAG: cytochrome c [Anaerolineae bacterium]|nr:cytochrome c [Anaerolineae bacterium]